MRDWSTGPDCSAAIAVRYQPSKPQQVETRLIRGAWWVLSLSGFAFNGMGGPAGNCADLPQFMYNYSAIEG